MRCGSLPEFWEHFLLLKPVTVCVNCLRQSLFSVLVAIFYMVAVACERGFDRTRRAYTALWVQHHRIFGTLKTITGKTFVAVSMWFGVLLFPMRLLPARIVPGNSLPGARGSSQETENRQVIPMGIHR